MRLRIRTLLLTVALLCSMTPTASACIYIPILDPFYWLFGGCGYGCGGASGGGYGYVNNGSTTGYGPNPYGVSRCIDDWLGYGYLRNQEGTLGHYPGRPFACYTPVFPRLLDPCSWFAPCPLFAPCGPAYGAPAPMVAPLAPPMQAPCFTPYAGQWQMPQMPLPAMMNPYGGNCNDPCGSQCMPQPMMQCQPAQVPVTTWRQVTVDRGNWQRVWVPRPVNMMVPQTQYVTAAPAMPMMQYPMMGAPAMGSDCGDNCGGMGDMIPGTPFVPGGDMMQGTNYPEMNSGPGCCGSGSSFSQPGFDSGIQMTPQSTMQMTPGSMSMSHMSMSPASLSRAGMPQAYNIAPYSSMSRWYANPGYATSGYRPQMTGRPVYGAMMTSQPQSASLNYNMAMMRSRQSAGGPMVPSHPTPNRMAQMQIPMAQMQIAQQRQQMTQQQHPQMHQMHQLQRGRMPHPMMQQQQYTAMHAQRPVSPLVGGTMPGSVYTRPNVAGNLHGNPGGNGSPSAGAPVAANSASGRSPIQQASWSQPAQASVARRYPNSVQ